MNQNARSPAGKKGGLQVLLPFFPQVARELDDTLTKFLNDVGSETRKTED